MTSPTAPFLWEPGSSNDGNYVALLTLMSTELNALASAAYAISSVGGTSGVFSNTNTGQALFGIPQFTFGGTLTPAAPLDLPCWFLRTLDGSVFEDASALLARQPDFVFVFSANSYASKTVQAPRCEVPTNKFKVATLNGLGGTMPSTGNLIKIGLVTPGY